MCIRDSYTNHMSAGAYRGYGATQGLFAVESAVNELADKLGIDPFVIRQRNICLLYTSCRTPSRGLKPISTTSRAESGTEMPLCCGIYAKVRKTPLN